MNAPNGSWVGVEISIDRSLASTTPSLLRSLSGAEVPQLLRRVPRVTPFVEMPPSKRSIVRASERGTQLLAALPDSTLKFELAASTNTDKFPISQFFVMSSPTGTLYPYTGSSR